MEREDFAEFFHASAGAGGAFVGLLFVAIEAVLGLRFVQQLTDIDVLRGLAFVTIGLYTIGILRAWTLLGDPQYGWSGWLNPLHDVEPTKERAEPE